MKIFDQSWSETDNDWNSTWIEVSGEEILSHGCTCKWGSFYCWSKKNGRGEKPCCHVERLRHKYLKSIREGKDGKIERQKKLVSKADW